MDQFSLLVHIPNHFINSEHLALIIPNLITSKLVQCCARYGRKAKILRYEQVDLSHSRRESMSTVPDMVKLLVR